jgi:adenylate cyclase
MGKDEQGTHHTLVTYLDAMAAAIQRYGGSIVDFAGDGVLAHFSTVTDALACAATVQQDFAVRNQHLAEDTKFQFRIGINLGDVFIDNDGARRGLYGHGTNVAARLESLAEPGGICISDAVRTAVGTKLPLDYEFAGEQHVKNIAEPVRAYHVRPQLGRVDELFDDNPHGDEMNQSQKGLTQFLIPRGNASKLLEVVEEPFHLLT